MKYIFILGRDPELAVLELKSYFKNLKILQKDEFHLVVDLPVLNFKKIIKELGGVQKIAQVIDDFSNLYRGKESKIKCGISNYTEEDVSGLKEDLKKYFKEEGLKVTWKKSHHQQEYLNPSEAQNLLELVVVSNYIGKTVAVFNPKDHKERDLKRPFRRELHSTSVRLAKILINLSGAKKGDKLLDPFCGVGTILMEAVLKKINVFGLDSSRECVKGSVKNLKWLEKSFSLRAFFKVVEGDATRLSRFVKKVDYVVTEPYMGPFLKKLPSEGEARKTIKKLEPMYNSLLKELKKVRVKKAVIIVPVFVTKSRKELSLKLDFKGFKVASIEYKTPTSKMLRKIVVLER